MSIQLPTLFEQKLHDHPHEKGIVYSAIYSFGQWFESSGTPIFFRDYTDHGPKHITNVLATAAAMIPDAAKNTISAADITIFVLATLLHDSALHLAEPGFHALIKGAARDRRVEAFDKASWPALWNEFLFAARRWNNEKLANVFGDDFVKQGLSVSNPFDRWGNLNSSDYKLIGEFIRRHHPRLAHEFSLYGVPGTNGTFLELPTAVSQQWKDIAGITARSHGVPLRHCLEHVSKQYQKRDYQSIHIVYLMALLRLADYLQIDAARAPDVVFGYRILPSRVSTLEWRAHQAVRNITPEHEDPESVEIQAEPADVDTFLRLREWLNGIQIELDTSWAVLGEVYGRYPALRDLGLLWRRVRSNLDDVESFSSTVSYLPRRIRVEVARAELLSLLIRPLYGDDPSYGVRELMQNAVDAVREREYYQSQNPQLGEVSLNSQSADVVIILSKPDPETQCAEMEISDRGIGMTESVITDYFLTAGASYRHSDQWQRTFERSDLPHDPTQPRAKVVRAGRFGVGALAAFLIGDEIEVETRHITSKDGFRFRMVLDQEAMQIERVGGLPVGTTIRILVAPNAYAQLIRTNETMTKPKYWDWFALSHPTVSRYKEGRQKPLSQQRKINLADWHIAKSELPLTIHWKHFSSLHPASTPRLTCNGIFISNAAGLPVIKPTHCREEGASVKYYIDTPAIHVTDPDGHLALGLTRKEILTEEYGFERDLYKSVMMDYMARLLALFPEALEPAEIHKFLDCRPFRLDQRHEYFTRHADFLFCKNGFCVPYKDSLKHSQHCLKNIVWIEADIVSDTEALSAMARLDSMDCVVLQAGLSLSKLNGSSRGKCVSEIVKSRKDGFDVAQFRYIEEQEFKRRKKVVNGDAEAKRAGNTKLWNERVTVQVKCKNGKSSRKIVESKGMPAGAFAFGSSFLEPRSGRIDPPFVAEFILNEPWSESLDDGILNHWWKRYFGDQWLPWSKLERRKLFPHAYEELAPYIAKYEKR